MFRGSPDNVIADALSRLSICGVPVTKLQGHWSGLQQIRKALQTDPIVQTNEADSEWLLQDGLWYYRQRLYIPELPKLRQQLIQEAHAALSAGHPGIRRTQLSLARHYYWPSLNAEARAYVQACDTCQRIKADHSKSNGLLQPLSIPTGPWQQVSLDFITGLPASSTGHNAILVFLD